MVRQANLAEQRPAGDCSGVRGIGFPRATWLTFRRSDASAKVDTSLNIYAQVLDDSVRDAAERVGNGLFTIVHTGEKEVSLTD